MRIHSPGTGSYYAVVDDQYELHVLASRWLEAGFFARAQAENTSASYSSSIALFLDWARVDRPGSATCGPRPTLVRRSARHRATRCRPTARPATQRRPDQSHSRRGTGVLPLQRRGGSIATIGLVGALRACPGRGAQDPERASGPAQTPRTSTGFFAGPGIGGRDRSSADSGNNGPGPVRGVADGAHWSAGRTGTGVTTAGSASHPVRRRL